jgi:hypothetical protein
MAGFDTESMLYSSVDGSRLFGAVPIEIDMVDISGSKFETILEGRVELTEPRCLAAEEVRLNSNSLALLTSAVDSSKE